MELTGKQKRALRAMAHHLDPVVLVGGGGLSEGVVAKVDEALEDHELIKVKVAREAPVKVKDAAADLAAASGGVVAQVIGRTVVLYRPRKKKPTIKLPPAGG